MSKALRIKSPPKITRRGAPLANRRPARAVSVKAAACPAERALREWVRLMRAGKPTAECAEDAPRDNWGDTPWEASVGAAQEAGWKANPTSDVGAAFQLLTSCMYGDVDGNRCTHRAMISAYAYLRAGITDADLTFAERHYFGGRALYALTDLSAKQATAAHWLRRYAQRAGAAQ